MLQTTDNKLQVLNTTYDPLNRPLQRSSATVGVLATWTYDTAPGGKGMAATETSRQDGQDYITTITGYNTRYQVMSSKIKIHGTFLADPLAGDWKFKATYNEGGQPVQVNKPKNPVDPDAPAANPGWDISTTTFDGFGRPTSLVAGSGAPYVTGSTFDVLGRVTERILSRSEATNIAALRRQYSYDEMTGAINTIKAGWQINGTTTWFQNDTYTRDLSGNVTSVTDNGLEAGTTNTASNTKECFLYDRWNRLTRAHSTTATTATTGTCATSTTVAVTNHGTLAPYDQTWTFDDINRMTARSDNRTGLTTGYNYDLATNAASPHAVLNTTVLMPDPTPDVVTAYTYDLNGAMVTRNGTGLTYDSQQRLTTYGGTADSYLYGTSNQRLIRTSNGTRTLYLPGMEASVTGATRTTTIFITIGTTHVATKTAVGAAGPTVVWSCASLQNSTVCQAPESATANVTPANPARQRYTPYGDQRVTANFTTTDHGFLNQPHDTTGLVYLNNRYHDPTLGHFISVDPLVGQTGMPYLYGDGNPVTLSDPNGLCATFSSIKGSDGVWRGGSHDDGKGPCGGSPTHEGPPSSLDVLSAASQTPPPTAAPKTTDDRPASPDPDFFWQCGPTSASTGMASTDCSWGPSDTFGWSTVILIVSIVVVGVAVVPCVGTAAICATAISVAGSRVAPVALDAANGGPNMPSPDDAITITRGIQATNTAMATAGDLSGSTLSNYNRFVKNLPAAAGTPTITNLADGALEFSAKVPATNIPGSYATYTKVVGADGVTTSFIKTTIAPDGSVVSVKVKYP